MQLEYLPTNTLKLLKAYMASHATFNALTYIQHQITDDAKREALKALSKFAAFIRKTTDDVDLENRDSTKEHEMLQAYCTMEQWRFSDRIKLEIEGLSNDFPLKMPTFFLVPFADMSILLGLNAHQEIEIEFNFFNKQNEYGIIANTSFDIDFNFISKFNQEQQNRYNLLIERIAIFKSTNTIELSHKKNQILLTFNK